MGKIIILDENTSNKIAAGEVIERPASVIKELVENSIDAKSTMINVEIKNGGISYIRISDNGTGIEQDDVEIAFERHATSKIRSANDLDNINTMGFRGEALASIAAVSNVNLVSRTASTNAGSSIRISGGKVIEKKNIGCPVGTSITVQDLFFNTPARYKFLKKDTAEASAVVEMLEKLALGNPSISIKLIQNGKLVFQSPGNGNSLAAVSNIYGLEIVRNICNIDFNDAKLKIAGFIGKPEFSRSSRIYQTFFLNNRYIKSKIVARAVENACKTIFPVGRYPFLLLFITVNPALVDVNVHPSKLEVRFPDESYISNSIISAISNALLSGNIVPGNNNEMRPPIFKSILTDEENQFEHNIQTTLSKSSISLISPIKSTTTDNLLNNVPMSSTINGATVIKFTAQNLTDSNTVSSSLDISDSLLDAVTENIQINNVNETNVAYIASENKNSEIDPSKDFKNYRIIGQVFSTYILIQTLNELLIIDQHAAHERITYERVLNQQKNGNTIVQELIIPAIINMTNSEYAFFTQYSELINELGFRIEAFGTNSVLIRAIPGEFNEMDPIVLFKDVLDAIRECGLKNMYELKEQVIYGISCKSAIKANKKLSENEITALIDELMQLDNPFTCPHGRPTTISLTKSELERRFKRT